MPTLLGDAYPITFGGYPTHMSTSDLHIWRTYQSTIPATARALYFDVRLGDGRPAGPETPDYLRRMWRLNTQKRADVVVEYPDRWHLIELRNNAQLNAIGRLLGYQALWKATPPDARPLTIELVTDNHDQDTADLARAHGITYTVLDTGLHG